MLKSSNSLGLNMKPEKVEIDINGLCKGENLIDG